MICQPDDNMDTIPRSDAAKIKMVSESTLTDALNKGVINGTEERVEWDDDFEEWMPKIPAEDLVYRVNMARPYITTIRIGVSLKRLAQATARTAQRQAAPWDIVPVNRTNMDLVLNMQRGSIDGNVYTQYLVDEVREALRLDRNVYQKRLRTGMAAYTQGLHPAPAFRPLDKVASSAGERSALGKAIEGGEIDALQYHDATLVVDSDALQEWRENENNHHSLFSDALLRA